MIELLSTVFLLRFCSQLLYKAIQTPQSFANVLMNWVYFAASGYAIVAYGAFADKNIDVGEILGVLVAAPILLGWGAVIWYGSKRLAQVPQEAYDQMYNLKAMGRGFMGIAVVFVIFASINMIFGVIWLVGAIAWVMLLVCSLGLILASKEVTFESFTYVPTLFFKGEERLFALLGLNVVAFGVVLACVVFLMPFLLSAWILWTIKSPQNAK